MFPDKVAGSVHHLDSAGVSTAGREIHQQLDLYDFTRTSGTHALGWTHAST